MRNRCEEGREGGAEVAGNGSVCAAITYCSIATIQEVVKKTDILWSVPKCENGQKVTKIQANSGKIVLFMKITSLFVCRKK